MSNTLPFRLFMPLRRLILKDSLPQSPISFVTIAPGPVSIFYFEPLHHIVLRHIIFRPHLGGPLAPEPMVPDGHASLPPKLRHDLVSHIASDRKEELVGL